ncbi:MAG: ABC transporter ATP-binding protein [Solirubrobacteraceae bacterium]
MSIIIQNLTKEYKNQTALENISLEINNNQIIGLLGPNGAGKSTLMKCIVGIISPNEGTIFINNNKVDSINNTTNKIIGYLSEENPLYENLRVDEFLKMCCEIREVGDEKIKEVVSQVKLEAVLNKKIAELSKGYKQRVGIAQAIIHNPEILIFDEPTNGLDPNQIIEMRALMREIGKNKTVIISTHIMQEVEAICDKVILLHHGKVIAFEKVDYFITKYGSLENTFKLLIN